MEMLVYLVGNNLQEIVAEVEKVVTYVGARNSITVADIKEVVSDTKVDSIFELTDSIGKRDLGKSLRNLNTILRDGEAPLMVLAMLTRHFRQLWRVKELCDKRLPPKEIGKTAGINPYFINGIMEQALNYRITEFKEIFERLFATDQALKTSGGKSVSLMVCLVMDICGKRAGRRRE